MSDEQAPTFITSFAIEPCDCRIEQGIHRPCKRHQSVAPPASPAPGAPTECVSNPKMVRVCSRGTVGCLKDHQPAAPGAPDATRCDECGASLTSDLTARNLPNCRLCPKCGAVLSLRAASGAPDIPALIARLRTPGHFNQAMLDEAADALTALSASHEALKEHTSHPECGYVYVATCAECRGPYPAWGVSSAMRCEDCRAKELSASHEALRQERDAADKLLASSQPVQKLRAQLAAAEAQIAALTSERDKLLIRLTGYLP